MGTSSPYGGPQIGLIPSWVDDPATGVETPPTSPAATPAPTSSSPDTSGAGSLRGARTAFNKFARTGNRDDLARSVSRYVRDGVGGSRRAARRMGEARASAGRLLGVVRDIARDGPVEALRRVNLANLAGQPAETVLLALLEAICPPGGTLDEAIARQGMLEAIDALAEDGLGAFDTLTPGQLEEFFLDVVARTIEARILNDIGSRGINLPTSVAAIDQLQAQLHDFVSGTVRQQLAGRLDGVASLTDRNVLGAADGIYERAFDVLAAIGDDL
ncbi:MULTISPECIES: Qat anti-phage system associated protein QatB [Brevundimonas]|jgi:hypothetical protein|nr:MULTISPECIES: Qat anti-phage system associated protein QatB [Brevundimonas]